MNTKGMIFQVIFLTSSVSLMAGRLFMSLMPAAARRPP
jgi:hypothetical protein